VLLAAGISGKSSLSPSGPHARLNLASVLEAGRREWMKSTQKKKRWQKVATTEKFTLFQSAKDRQAFEVSWKRPDGYGRRRFNAPSIGSALEQAPIVAGLVVIQSQGSERVFELEEAFSMALDRTSRGKRSRRDWLYAQERFLKWLLRDTPGCTHWALLTREILRRYLDTFAGKSDTTKRLAMQFMAQTSGYMSREYGFRNIAERLGTGSKLKTTPAEVYLPDVVGFLDWLAETNPRLEVGAALQGLGGLQLQEATRLDWSKVDLKRGLIEISGEVKNAYRNRVIPVADRLLEALQRADEARKARRTKVQAIHEAVIVCREGIGYGEGSWFNYSKEVSAAIRQWNPKILWKPKDLRNCLPTFAVMKGILGDVWEQFIGHAPRSITARHYVPRLAGVSTGEFDALERQMKVFRLHVTGPLNEAIAEIERAEILNNFERADSHAEGGL